MEKEIEKLLSNLCVKQGFCIPPNAAKNIKNKSYLEADEFACLVLKAEKMDIDKEIKWRRVIRNEFSSRFGNVLTNE